MKTSQLIASLVLAATFVTSAPAADHSSPSDGLVPFTGRPHIERGMNRETVREMFGAPSAQLSSDVWVYFDFQARRPVELRINVANPENRDTLVIAFTKDRVTLIRLCDRGPVGAFLAQQAKSKTAATNFATR